MVYNHRQLFDVRRELRNNATPQEIILWKYLRRSGLGYKFRRQQSIECFVVDFFCKEKRLIVEIDGSQHLANKHYDYERTQFLKNLGYKVIRFWNNEIDKNLEQVLNTVYHHLTTPALRASPPRIRRGGRNSPDLRASPPRIRRGGSDIKTTKDFKTD